MLSDHASELDLLSVRRSTLLLSCRRCVDAPFEHVPSYRPYWGEMFSVGGEVNAMITHSVPSPVKRYRGGKRILVPMRIESSWLCK